MNKLKTSIALSKAHIAHLSNQILFAKAAYANAKKRDGEFFTMEYKSYLTTKHSCSVAIQIEEKRLSELQREYQKQANQFNSFWQLAFVYGTEITVIPAISSFIVCKIASNFSA